MQLNMGAFASPKLRQAQLLALHRATLDIDQRLVLSRMIELHTRTATLHHALVVYVVVVNQPQGTHHTHQTSPWKLKTPRVDFQSFVVNLVVSTSGGNSLTCLPASCKCQLAKLLPPSIWAILSCSAANLSQAFESESVVVVTLLRRCY